jgi:hypothetical protein
MSEFKDIVALCFERFTAAQTLWNLYIAVTAGLLAFVASAQGVMKRCVVRAVLTVAFIFFAAANLFALYHVHQQYNSLAKWAQAVSSDEETHGLRCTLVQRPTYELIPFHLVMDGLVIAAIWYIPYALAKP